MDLQKFEENLYREIPIAQGMGVRAVEVSGERLVLRAPLAPNTNHTMTAFGGSIYSVGVLACWSMVSETVRLAGISFEYIMIQDGRIDYQLPVLADFTATCAWTSPELRTRFLSTLKRKGLARVEMSSLVSVGNAECAVLSGRFVARRGL